MIVEYFLYLVEISLLHQIEFMLAIYYCNTIERYSHNVQKEIYFIMAMKTSVYCCLRSIGKSYFHVPLIESLNGLFPRTDIRGHASIEQLRINTKNSVPLLKNVVVEKHIL